MQAEADDLRSQNQQLNKQFAAASGEVKTLKGQVRALWGPARRPGAPAAARAAPLRRAAGKRALVRAAPNLAPPSPHVRHAPAGRPAVGAGAVGEV